jgi:hypothetical protein
MAVVVKETGYFLPYSSELAGDQRVDLGWPFRRFAAAPLTGFVMDLDHHGWSVVGWAADRDPVHLAEHPGTRRVTWDVNIAEMVQDWWWLGKPEEED